MITDYQISNYKCEVISLNWRKCQKRCFCEVKMGSFWNHDSTRNGASSSCSCSYSATDLAFHQIGVDRNIEIIWGVCTLQSARNNILFAFPRAGKYKGKTRGAFKGPGLELLSLRPFFRFIFVPVACCHSLFYFASVSVLIFPPPPQSPPGLWRGRAAHTELRPRLASALTELKH